MVASSPCTHVLTGGSSLLSGRVGDREEQPEGGTDHWDRAEPKRAREEKGEKASHRVGQAPQDSQLPAEDKTDARQSRL